LTRSGSHQPSTVYFGPRFASAQPGDFQNPVNPTVLLLASCPKMRGSYSLQPMSPIKGLHRSLCIPNSPSSGGERFSCLFRGRNSSGPPAAPAAGTLTPPLNLWDYGTSRWQLAIERYTNLSRLRKEASAAGLAHDCRGSVGPDVSGVQRPRHLSKGYCTIFALVARSQQYTATAVCLLKCPAVGAIKGAPGGE
jgi:hypothetical protein